MTDAGLHKEATRFASATTRSLVIGNANALAQTYSTQNFFSALGEYLGDEAAKSTNDSMPSTPVRETFGGAAALVALRPRREGSSTDTDTDPLGGAIDAGAAAFGRAASSAWSSFTGAVSSAWNGTKNFFSDLGTGISNTFQRTVNFVSGDGFNTNSEIYARAVHGAAANIGGIIANLQKGAISREAAISAGMNEGEVETLFAAQRAGKITDSRLDRLISDLADDFDVDLADRLAEPENELLAGRAGGIVKKPATFKFSAEQNEAINFLKSHGYVEATKSNKIVLKAGVSIDEVASYLPESMGGVEVLEQIQGGQNKIFARYTSVMHLSGSERNDSSNRFGLKRGRGAYINGFKDVNYVDDGGAIYRDASGKYIALNTPQKIAAFLRNPDRGRILLTQNGMQNQLMDAIGMMEQAGDVARNKGKFKGGNLMIFNDTGGYTADGLNYIRGSEKAQKTIEYLLRENAFKKGDVFIAHSQGGQITTNAIAANRKYVPVQLLVFGSAHTATPNKLVDRMIDFRNAHDPVAGEQVVGVFNRNAPDASKNNYERYEQVTYPGILPKIHWGGSSQYQEHKGGTGHSFAENYLDALEWYLAQKGGRL